MFYHRERTIRKCSYNQEIWVVTFASNLTKLNWYCKISIKIFKDHVNVMNSNKKDEVKIEDGVKTKDGEIRGNLRHRYIGDKYEGLINNVFAMTKRQRFTC